MLKRQLFALLYELMGYRLPDYDTMDEYIDFFYPNIRHLGEDLVEMDYYMDRRWREIHEDSSDMIIRIFKPSENPKALDTKTGISGARYIRSVNGEITEGVWAIIAKSNSFLIRRGKASFELFDLVFLDENFFILKKHRNQYTPIDKYKYVVLVNERLARRPWRFVMELLYNTHRKNMALMTLFVILAIVGLFFLVFLYL